jgi:hypothetical protein
MKTFTEMISNQLLSQTNMRFLSFAEGNPESCKPANYKILELNDEIFHLQPWPTFINREAKESFGEAGVKVFDLHKALLPRLFQYDPVKISEFYEIPLAAAKLQLEGVGDAHLQQLVSRGDFILSHSGLKCIEFNVTPNLGGWQVPVWESLYLNNPIIQQFLKENRVTTKNENLLYLLLEHVLDACFDKVPPDQGQWNIALVVKGFRETTVTSTGIYLNNLYRRLWQNRNGTTTGQLFLCDYQDLKVKDQYLYYKKNRIQTVIEMYLGLVTPGVLNVFKADHICLLNGPVTELLSNKLNLALLSDYEKYGIFTPEEIKVIDRYIPWSRKTVPGRTVFKGEKVDLENFILENRETLILKPAIGLGGENIWIGQRTSAADWENAVNKAFNERKWMVQEWIEPLPGVYLAGENCMDHHDLVLGIFVFGNRYGGAWVRIMPKKSSKGIINCHQGAAVSVIFEVEE